MAADLEHDEDHTFHDEAGQTIFDGPAEREVRRIRAREKEDSDFKGAQIAISQKQTSIATQTLVTQIALVIFGLLGTCVGIYQARTSRIAAAAAESAAHTATQALAETRWNNERQAALAERAREDAKIANEASTNESNKALQSAIDNFHLDQRAWVSATTIMGVPEVGKQWIVDVKVKNTGKTFAEKFTLISGFVLNVDKPNFSEVDEKSKSTPLSVSLISPNGEYESQTPITGSGSAHGYGNPTQAYIDSFKAGNGSAYAFGKMTYFDVFGVPHWSTYCARLNRDLRWENCDTYNDADEAEPRIRKR